MKKISAALLALLLLLALCSCAAKPADTAESEPPEVNDLADGEDTPETDSPLTASAAPIYTDQAPPELLVMPLESSDRRTAFVRNASGYTWNWDEGDGTSAGVIADPIHPLDENILNFPMCPVAEDEANELWWEFMPDSFSAVSWSWDDIGNYEAEPTEEQVSASGTIYLSPERIYVVYAEWTGRGGSYGDASYYLVTCGEGAYGDDQAVIMNEGVFADAAREYLLENESDEMIATITNWSEPTVTELEYPLDSSRYLYIADPTGDAYYLVRFTTTQDDLLGPMDIYLDSSAAVIGLGYRE